MTSGRGQEVARAWPARAPGLGEAFTDRFVAFAAGRPLRLVVLARAPGLGERGLALPLGPSHARSDGSG